MGELSLGWEGWQSSLTRSGHWDRGAGKFSLVQNQKVLVIGAGMREKEEPRMEPELLMWATG
jgi:hypothetical protein